MHQSCVGAHGSEKIVSLTEACVLHGSCDIKHIEAFRHHHGMEVDVTTGNPTIDFAGVSRMVKSIFAGLERSMSEIVPNQKSRFAADDPGIFQINSDTPCRRARFELH